MKWAIFAVALAGVLPLAGWLRRNPREHPKIWMLVGVLPFLLTALPRLEHRHYRLAGWPGMAKGIEISALDLFVLAIYLSQPRTTHRLPFRLSMAFYFFAVLLSVFSGAGAVCDPLLCLATCADFSGLCSRHPSMR